MKYKHLFYYWAFRHSVGNTFALSVAAILLVLFIVWAVFFHTGMWIAAILWLGVWAAWCSRLNPAWRHTFGRIRVVDKANKNYYCIWLDDDVVSVYKLRRVWSYGFQISGTHGSRGFKSAPEAAFAAMDLKKQIVEKKP